jgi:hypothetical protein
MSSSTLAEMEVLRMVAERLEDAGLAYMVSGSVALSFYAQPRMTRDIDLVIELPTMHVPRFVAVFEKDFDCDLDEIRDAARGRRMFNLIHTEKVVKVDFIVRKDEPFRREEFARRRRGKIEGFSAWIVSPEDLVLSKLAWAKDSHSDFQLRDVHNLLISVTGIDLDYLERWATHLDVRALLDEVRP